jgi:malate dehydrogenase (oxaloacetate-decarboxylating)
MDIKLLLSGTIATDVLEVPFGGHLLLERPLFNKGTAFTRDERRTLGLLGLLPPTEETLDEQAVRSYEAYGAKETDLERHIYLRQLQDTNETLFYRLLLDHLDEMMPIVYTPTVGLACETFSHIYRRPRGLFISYPERDEMDAILENAASPQVEVIVVTDGERILGLGDQGAGGLGIPIGKLSLYTACGGIHPATTLPILLDSGTNNQERLRDPLYIGWRHERITGPVYDGFVDAFVQAVKRKFPRVVLQWEDFAQPHAGPLLDRYRNQLCTFNDDIQGTAAITTATLLAAVKVAGGRLRDQRVAILGAGSAGCGVAEQLVTAMMDEGLTEAEARAHFFLIDRAGLLHDGLKGLPAFQRKLAQPQARVAGWQSAEGQPISLLDVVKDARPTIVIGTSGQPGTFTEEIIRAMASYAERPIIFPLSNPTSRAEATPADLIAWTNGRALIATGSPFGDVTHDGRQFPVAQCNNSYVFPGLGLGILASGARRVNDAMFMAAARALADYSTASRDAAARLLPPLAESRRVARAIALAVATAAQHDGLATPCSAEELERAVDAKIWQPRYLPITLRKDEVSSRGWVPIRHA